MKTFLLLGIFAVAMIAGCKDLSIFPDGGKDKHEDPPTSLTLKDIAGKEYRLVSWQTFGINDAMLGSRITSVPAGQRYTIRFLNGQVSGQIDCNSYIGTYTELPTSHNVTIAPAVVTNAVCGSSSLDKSYHYSLQRAMRYEISDNSLKIYWQPEVSIPEDTMWVMNFVPADMPDSGNEIALIPSFAPYSLIDFAPCAPYGCEVAPTIKDDILTMQVNYSGGCREHSFSAIFDEDTFQNPAFPTTGTLPLIVLHQNNGDDCKAMITRTIKVSISSLRSRLLLDYPMSSTNTVKLRIQGIGNWAHEVDYKFR